MQENVVFAGFDVDSKAYQGLSALRTLDSSDQIELRSGSVVKKGKDGKVTVVEGDTASTTGPGGLIGALAGPVGMLVGAGAGTLFGQAADKQLAQHGDDILAKLSTQMQDGETVLVAWLGETSDDAVDEQLSTKLGGTVVRVAADALAGAIEDQKLRAANEA